VKATLAHKESWDRIYTYSPRKWGVVLFLRSYLRNDASVSAGINLLATSSSSVLILFLVHITIIFLPSDFTYLSNPPNTDQKSEVLIFYISELQNPTKALFNSHI